MKITLGRQIEEIKKKDSKNEKNLLKNRNSDELNKLNADDVYFHSNAVKNIKLGSQLVNRIYLNNSIVYDLEDTIDLKLFHSFVPKATATSIIFDIIENQDISNYNLVGFCDTNNHIAVYQNNTEYLVLNIRNAVNYAPVSCSKFFYNYTLLSHCVLHNFNTNNVINMRSMFSGCSSLTSLDISSFNTNKVGSMFMMFKNCSSLISLNLSNFYTNQCVFMNYLFEGCSSLKSLDISNFNTDNVTSFWSMFYGCSSLTSLDISSFNTNKVKEMSFMFYNCSKLHTIISNTFSKSALTEDSGMFSGCTDIVGGNGTTYDAKHIDAKYAIVDGENGLPGYFTAPAATNNNK